MSIDTPDGSYYDHGQNYGENIGNASSIQQLVPVNSGPYGNDFGSVPGDYNEYRSPADHEFAASESQEVVSFMPVGHDETGRLLKPAHERIDLENYPEDIGLFVSSWREQQLSSRRDWEWTSRVVWPDITHTVSLKRLDLFEHLSPHLQQGTTNIETSRRIHSTPGWQPLRSIFFMDAALSVTKTLLVESTGPPRRHKFRPHDRENQRDFSSWILQEEINAYIGADRIPGCSDFFVDFCDLPDRYFISSEAETAFGMRRMYRFAAYAATQYFILEKRVFSELLEAEGGFGMTYDIQPGPLIFAQKDWRVIGSFFGFDHQLLGSSCFTVYRRQDPFPRMLVALEGVPCPEEWDSSIKFFAFDVPVPGSALYTLQHCLRSIHSAQASIPRHRLTTEHPHSPWEFRMNVYVMPAALEDCSFTLQRTASSSYSGGGSSDGEAVAAMEVVQAGGALGLGFNFS